MNLPAKNEIIDSIITSSSSCLISNYFGSEWYKKGDPRPLLQVTYEDLHEWYKKNGIPKHVLYEGEWNGHDNVFVITEKEGKWLVGYAERGGAFLRSEHLSIEDAREAVLQELWSGYESAGNPSHWANGVAPGTPYPISILSFLYNFLKNLKKIPNGVKYWIETLF